MTDDFLMLLISMGDDFLILLITIGCDSKQSDDNKWMIAISVIQCILKN